MKIGIIGTRGIPNFYGGFEQFTQYVAPALVLNGHEVCVYTSSSHPYKENQWNGVSLLHKYDPESKIGTAGQFIYDMNCILDSRKRNFDVILQLGYTSSSIWSFLLPRDVVIVTNMDGLEWKRTKYSRLTQNYLKQAERWAVLSSDSLIADSLGIQKYLYQIHKRKSVLIAYGAGLFTAPDETVIEDLGCYPYSYSLAIARMEPENNIETIVKGYLSSTITKPLLLIGSTDNKFGSYLRNKYENQKIKFLGPLYDMKVLDNLRHYSHFYFHGHSVGGTNPSLLEAMASQSLVFAHDNIFNRSVLQKDAFYFSNSEDITTVLEREKEKSAHAAMIESNNEKIRLHYSWDHIVHLLENHLKDAVNTYGRNKKI
ncbi:MAG TPA: DUF1972 domain-containing protein [Flavitalea sp.]|nr:DUF1972 domain-containing protein [Flavitalea sp.]